MKKDEFISKWCTENADAKTYFQSSVFKQKNEEICQLLATLGGK